MRRSEGLRARRTKGQGSAGEGGCVGVCWRIAEDRQQMTACGGTEVKTAPMVTRRFNCS